MKVLLTSAGLETKEIQDYFVSLVGMDMREVRVLFIPVAAVDAAAIAVLPKCMNDLLKCGIPEKNIAVYDMHQGMDIGQLGQYDVVYLCGGSTAYLLERINDTGLRGPLLEYMQGDGVVLGVSAGNLIFANNLPGNLGLLDTKLEVHCQEGERIGKLAYPLKENLCLTNTCALAVRSLPYDLEIVG